MRLLLFFLCFLLSIKSFSQEGYLYLKHFEVPLPSNQYLFNDLTTDDQNRLLIAHRGGILQFDGKLWDKINTESTPNRFIEIGDSTFVLTKSSISLLQQDIFKQNVLETVYENPPLKYGTDLVKYGKDFYYLIDNDIYRLNGSDLKVDSIFSSNLGYEDIFSFHNRLFAFEGNYLLEFIDGTWVDLNMYASENSDFVFSCQTENRVFFAYDNGDFFIFDGERLVTYSKPLNEYLRENYPVSGKVIGDKLLIATISGGAVVVNIFDGKIDYTIQYHNGLPADEVKAITVDQQGGIWLAHERGISRAIPDLPIKEFQNYPGISGLPRSVFKRHDTLVVGTNEGLFYLEAIKNYEELEKVFREKVRVLNPGYGKESSDDEDNSLFGDLFGNNTDEHSDVDDFIENKLDYYKKEFKKQGYRFMNLREKLKEKELQLRDSINQSRNTPKAQKQQKYIYKTVKKVVNVSKLKSIKYQFSKFANLEKKVLQMVETSGDFYVLASDGLYIIRENSAIKVWSKLFLTGMRLDEKRHNLWIYGTEGLFRWPLNESQPSKKGIPTIVSSPVTDITLHQDQLIVCNFSELKSYQITQNNALQSEHIVAIDNPFSQNVLVFENQGKICLVKANGLYEYQNNSLKLIESYEKKEVSYIKNNTGKIWFSLDGNWKILNQEKEGDELNWLKILPAMSQVYMESGRFIYFLSSDMILRLDKKQTYHLKEPTSFIRGAYQASSEMFEGEDIKLTHDNNSIKISLSTPEYLFPEGVKYKYYVKGLKDDWSLWSGATEIEFPFVPTGEYTLQIRSKTGLYANEEELNFDFDVLPPYWQTWWFYMLEIAFFSILILISQRLNRSSRNSYLTNTITFLTLILFIEFIATVLENNLEGYVDESPVYGFILNVILALSISPIERGMNKLLLIMKSQPSKNLVHRMREEDQLNKEKNGKNQD